MSQWNGCSTTPGFHALTEGQFNTHKLQSLCYVNQRKLHGNCVKIQYFHSSNCSMFYSLNAHK